MAEEGGESQQEYKLVTEAGQVQVLISCFNIFDRETVNKSFGYTGKGVATYPNGDIYEGHFVNGVSQNEFLSLFYERSARVKKVHTSTSLRQERTEMPQRTNMLVAGRTTRRMESVK